MLRMAKLRNIPILLTIHQSQSLPVSSECIAFSLGLNKLDHHWPHVAAKGNISKNVFIICSRSIIFDSYYIS